MVMCVQQVRTRPITTDEFTTNLVPLLPLNPEEENMLKDFFEKTPLMKKRKDMLNPANAAEDQKKAAKKKQIRSLYFLNQIHYIIFYSASPDLLFRGAERGDGVNQVLSSAISSRTVASYF